MHRPFLTATRRPLFLNINDHFGVAELFCQALMVALQLLVLLGERITFAFGAALARGKAWRTPALRSRRQVSRCEETKPSRRSKGNAGEEGRKTLSFFMLIVLLGLRQ